ncbi:hypothetical protein [Microbacterium hydrocarbonoxydans]|uniref:Uncharacterized protein n=1 Tax=Microbacterium hydrocarbonoxydans TaxID=273678 RepID=A0A1H4IQP8_9MICO|nr:hypothetical protein [Microbacterium hydrocarbonoxydans]SEB35996.1 hypothetical protein SAMN04489807_0124 [Microbacterium hydrocarbonoxydans]
MSSEATTTFHSNADAATTAAAVQRVLAENKAKVIGQSPDGTQIDFQTRKTLLNWELLGRAITTPAASGSDVHLSLDVHHNRPPALLDGKKNRKAVEKLAEQIQAAID